MDEIKKNKDFEKNLLQIDFHITSISKQTIRDEIINWFQQSPLHWLFVLFLMKNYYLNKELSKQELLEAINEHLVIDGKRTLTTEFKYIDDAISKKFIYSKVSTTDSRKRLLYPTQKTIDSINNWFNNFHTKFNKLY